MVSCGVHLKLVVYSLFPALDWTLLDSETNTLDSRSRAGDHIQMLTQRINSRPHTVVALYGGYRPHKYWSIRWVSSLDLVTVSNQKQTKLLSLWIWRELVKSRLRPTQTHSNRLRVTFPLIVNQVSSILDSVSTSPKPKCVLKIKSNLKLYDCSIISHFSVCAIADSSNLCDLGFGQPTSSPNIVSSQLDP